MSSEHAGENDQGGEPTKLEKTERRIRRIGYVVLFAAGLAISVPMVIGAIQGVQTDRVWDPFTGEPLSADEADLDCLGEAADLAYLAGADRDPDGTWEQRYRRWKVRCRSDHPEMHLVLTDVRGQMRGDEEPAVLEENPGHLD